MSSELKSWPESPTALADEFERRAKESDEHAVPSNTYRFRYRGHASGLREAAAMLREAIKAWNTRPSPPVDDATRERVARAISRKVGAWGDTDRVEQQRVDTDWRQYLDAADAAIAAIAAAAARIKESDRSA